MKLSRRGFVKAGMAGSAALLGIGKAKGLVLHQDQNQGRHIGASVAPPGELRERKIVPSTCGGCTNSLCGIVGYIQRDKVVKIEGNPFQPNNTGRLCNKGQAGLNLLYSPERVLHPLKRIGERGSGKWRRITWDEVFGEIAARLRKLKDEDKPEGFALHVGLGEYCYDYDFAERFTRAYGTSNFFDSTSLGPKGKNTALDAVWGSPGEMYDLANTRYILNFGINFYESHINYLGYIEKLINTRLKNNAKLVTFDPRLSNTAGKSDEWFPIKPGTDGIVALAMANVIMSEGLHNKEFLENWVNYPELRLRQYLSNFTPEDASRVSGVPAKDIRRIAREFATTRPAVAASYKGVAGSYNSFDAVRSIFLLNVLTGNIEVEGGVCYPQETRFRIPQPLPEPMALKRTQGDLFNLLREGSLDLELYMSLGTNPAYSYADCASIIASLKDEELIPFHVCMDPFLSETAALADIVLPSTTYLEEWSLENIFSVEGKPYISLRQPLAAPLGEAVSFKDLCLRLADSIGGMKAYYPVSSVEEYIQASLSQINGFDANNDWAGLKNYGVHHCSGKVQRHGYHARALMPEELEGSVWRRDLLFKNGEAIGRFYMGRTVQGFNTPSRKIEVYSQEVEAEGHSPLPGYLHDEETIRLKENELILITFKWSTHTSTKTANSKWLVELVHTNPVWINPETARRLGIDDGDKVRIESETGSVTAKVWLTQGVHPEVAALSTGCGHWDLGGVAKAEKYKSDDFDTSHIWWKDNGAHPNWVVPRRAGQPSENQIWHTRVKVQKA